MSTLPALALPFNHLLWQKEKDKNPITITTFSQSTETCFPM